MAMRRSVVVFITLLSLLALISCSKKETGPEISLYSDIYQVGEQWFCPLCNQPVENGDRSKIDPNLYLSEWHDIFLDADTFDKKINHISDRELVSSFATALSGQTLGDSLKALLDYFTRRSDLPRYYFYDAAAQIPFIPLAQFIEQVNGDSLRRAKLIADAQAVAHPDSGYTIGGHYFGWTIDFMHPWQGISDYSVHSLHFLQPLVAAYHITGDEFYLHSFEDIFNQWYEQKDRIVHQWGPMDKKVYGVIWYELGLDGRICRHIDALRAFGDRLQPETRVRLLKMILGSARWLQECLSRTPFHPYNWQVHTATSLTYAGLAFLEFTEAPIWLTTAKENMEKHFVNDILSDGGHNERSGGYTQYTFGMLHRYLLIRQYFAGDQDSYDRWMPRLEKLMEFTALNLAPTGVNCPFNDCGRGTSLAQMLLSMGELFNRGDFIGAASPALDPAKVAAAQVRPRTPEAKSKLFPDSKYAVMRTGWNPESYFMMINYGPFANHAHYDILDFEIFANGIPLAVDAGIGVKGYSDPIHVSWYKGSESHNMLTVDEAICVKRDIEGEGVVWAAQDFCDYFRASHRGYQRYHSAVCRRDFAFVRDAYWLIIDQVSTPKSGQKLDWHLHSPLTLKQDGAAFVSEQRPGALFLLTPEGAQTCRILHRQAPADLRGIEGEPDNREIDWLTLRKQSKADSTQDRFAVLIFPLAASAGPDPEDQVDFQELQSPDPSVRMFQVTTADFQDLLIFSDGKIRRFAPNIESDFLFAWLRSVADAPAQVSAVGMTQLKWGEQLDIRLAGRSDFEQKF